MSEKLLPCPFCGGPASIERYGDRRQSTIYQCDNCSCSLETGEEWGHGREWNRRPAAISKDAENAKLRNALYECEEYFDNRADADHDETGFVPNEEMKLLHAVRDALLGGSDA